MHICQRDSSHQNVISHLRLPVKFPGWSQPPVSGLQARTLVVKKAKRVTKVIYIMAISSDLR